MHMMNDLENTQRTRQLDTVQTAACTLEQVDVFSATKS